MPSDNAQAYWEAFAAARRTDDDAQTAALALHGSEPLYDAYRDRAERLAVYALLPRIEPHWRALDLGCGPGRWTVPLAKSCAAVVAVDFSEQMLTHARDRAHAAGVAGKISFMRADLQMLDCAQLGGPFDLVFAAGVLQFFSLEALQTLMPKLAACVSPGGLLLHRETRARRSFEKTSVAGDVSFRSFYKNFADYCALFSKNGFTLRGRRSIMPPNPYYSMYAKLFKPGAGPQDALRAIIGMHEYVTDPLWRWMPEMTWWMNSRRPTDNVAALYQKTDAAK